MIRILLPFSPALLLAVAAWGGGFFSGARLWGSVAVAVAVLTMVVVTALAGRLPARRLLDPLALGEVLGNSTVLSRVLALLLMTALAAAVCVSWWGSPVLRAGLVAMVLLPAYLLLPAAVAGCWRSREERRWGLAGVAMVALAVAVHGLWDHWVMGSPRAAMPLGHHNLLAVWLLAVGPLLVGLALAEAKKSGKDSKNSKNSPSGPDPVGFRWLGGVALVSGLVALLATRSLAGGLGLVVALVLAAALLGERWVACPRRRWAWTGVGVLAVGALATPRLLRMVAGEDVSALARWGYWQAGWRGFLERPWLGWGPGGTPWTLGMFLEPRPGVNPPGEVVGQLHGQPVQLLYELGAVGAGLLAVVVGWFLLARWREIRRRGGGSWVARVGLVALGGAGVALLTTSVLEIPGVVVALAVAAGGAMTSRPVGIDGPSAPPARHDRRPSGASGVSALAIGYGLGVSLLVLLPLWRAHGGFEAFVASEGVDRKALETAVAEDPRFPWYPAWWAWVETTPGGGMGASGEEAPLSKAARGAPGVGVFASTLGAAMADLAVERRRQGAGVRNAGYPVRGADLRQDAEETLRRAEAILVRACHLDPLGPFAPWFAMTSAVRFGELESVAAGVEGVADTEADAEVDAEVDAEADRAARALLAEPRLLAATFWHGRENLRRAAVARISDWPGVPLGLRAAWAERASDLPAVAAPDAPGAALADLALTVDAVPSRGMALHLFRRPALTVRPLAVEVDVTAAAAVDLPSAAVLRETSPEAFADRGCPDLEGSPADPQELWKSLWKRGGFSGGKPVDPGR